MKKLNIAILALATCLLMPGCVTKKEYLAVQQKAQERNAALRTQLKEANEKNRELEVKLAESRATTENVNLRLEEAKKANTDMQEVYASVQKSLDESLAQNKQGNVNISKLVDEINASNKFIKQLVDAKTKSDSLNQALSNKLTRSLSREEMKDVDVQVLKGVVYISLADNMLYKSGSYEVSSRADETLAKIAKIISDYKDYEVLVEGNTDSVPISRENIRNNWDLSALRASSVVQVLQKKYGIDPKRLTAAGRGEYNPLVANDTEANRARNRRTQIIITPSLDQFMDLIDHAPEAEQE